MPATVEIAKKATPRAARSASDLTRRCVVASERNPHRWQTWSAAISTFFLFVGIVGLWTRPIKAAVPVIVEIDEAVPVLFDPPSQPATSTEVAAPATPEVAPEPLPAVPQVVAPANVDVSFAVPTVGVVVPAKLAAAPEMRPTTAAPVVAVAAAPQPTVFDGTGLSGNFPKPTTYPPEAKRRGLQGTVTLYAIVERNGLATQVEVRESSGSTILDNFAADWLKRHWVWQPGQVRHFLVPFVFKLT